MISKVDIRGFRSIKKQRFENIGNTLLFVGKNNSGKSTFLNAIRIFFDYNKQNISVNDIHHNSSICIISIVKKIDDRFYIELNKTMKNNKDKTLLDFEKIFRDKNHKRELNTKVYYDEFKTFIVKTFLNGKYIRSLGIKMFASNKDNNKKYTLIDSNFVNINNDSQVNKSILEAFKVEIASIDDERLFSEEETGGDKSISNSLFNLFLKNLSSNIIYNDEETNDKKISDLTVFELNSLLNKKLSQESEKFLAGVNKKFSNYYGDELKIDWEFEKDLKSRIKFKSSFKKGINTFDFQSTGSGTRSIYLLSLLQAYMDITSEEKEKKGLFLIEEPELYLYPKLENDMSEILREISKEHQVFITTHSGNLAQKFEKDSIYLTDVNYVKDVFETTYKKLDNITELMDNLGFNSYPFLEKKYLIIVEGKSDIKAYQEIIQKHYNKYLEQTLIIETGGVHNVVLPITIHFIKNTELFNKTLIIIDSDGSITDDKIDKKINSIIQKFDGNNRDKVNLSKKIYLTENSTMLEMLSLDADLLFDEPKFVEKWNNFLIEQESQINTELDKKLKSEILTIDEYELFKNKDISLNKDKFILFKGKVADKELVKLYRRNIAEIKCISTESDFSVLKKKVPKLVDKLEQLFENQI